MMSLPIAWVEQIFKKLALNYGADFMGRYKGLDITEVKADWAEELAYCVHRPDAIKFALSTLPDRAPTAQQFRALCMTAPAPVVAAKLVYEPKADPERLAVELAKLADLRNMPISDDNRGWAKAILAKHDAGVRMSPTTLELARLAVKL
jgi:hypothetical protein